MRNFPGTSVAALRALTLGLARDAIFGREALARSSLSGRKGTKTLCQEKMNYIKTIVHSRIPHKLDMDFETIWTMCRVSLSKSCHTQLWCDN